MLFPLSLIEQSFLSSRLCSCSSVWESIYKEGLCISSLFLPANAILLVSRYTQVAWSFTGGNDKCLSCVELLNSLFVYCLHTKYQCKVSALQSNHRKNDSISEVSLFRQHYRKTQQRMAMMYLNCVWPDKFSICILIHDLLVSQGNTIAPVQ